MDRPKDDWKNIERNGRGAGGNADHTRKKWFPAFLELSIAHDTRTVGTKLLVIGLLQILQAVLCHLESFVGIDDIKCSRLVVFAPVRLRSGLAYFEATESDHWLETASSFVGSQQPCLNYPLVGQTTQNGGPGNVRRDEIPAR